MCAVSMVIEGWRQPSSPNYVPFTQQYPDPETALRMLEILEKLDAIDKRLGKLECLTEEGIKEGFLQRLKERADEQPTST